MAKRWGIRVSLFLAVALAASAVFYICVNSAGRGFYTGRINMVRRLPADQAWQRDPAGSISNVGVIVTSERVLQSAARTMSLLNISKQPEELLSTIKVKPSRPGVIGIELTSRDPEQAKEAIDTVAAEAQTVYSETMNRQLSPSERKNGFRLQAIEQGHVFPIRNDAPAKTALFAPIFAGALLVLFLGVGAGRSAKQSREPQDRQPTRWARIVIPSCLALFVISAAVYVYSSLSAPNLYCGRAKLIQLPSEEEARRPDAIKRLDRFAGAALSKAARPAARTLKLFNISMSPDAVLRMTKVERVPDSTVLKVEVVSSDSEAAEVVADVVASQVQQVYRGVVEAPAAGHGDGSISELYTVEPAHTYPTRAAGYDIARRISGYVTACMLVFLLGVGVGRVVGRRTCDTDSLANLPLTPS
ncbi:MAG: hypothetical protein Q7T82_11795 [Armatimonadota bacterium]|nr:hypothetical protein [Armatimonadota bacterium]